MNKNNVFKKAFIILILIIIPLMITIGAAAWIMISDERIKPQYNPNSVFYIYLNGQNKDYTGGELLPDSNVAGAIDWDKGTITHECFRKNESGTYVEYTNKLGNSTPLDAGDYLIRFSDSDDDTALLGSDVNFTINKVKPTISSWPTLSSMYWGDTPSFSGGDTSKGSFSIVDGSFAFKSGESRASAELPYTVSLLYTPNDTTNYNTLTSIANVKLKAVANVGSTFYATVDEAITSTTSGTIYVMLTEAGSDKAKTIGATTSNTTVTLASGVTLYVPYYMDTSTSPYTYNKSQSQTQSDESNLKEYGELYHGSAAAFADSVANNTYLKNYIIIDSDTTLSITSGATLQVTGIIGGTNNGIQGHTSLDYAEVKMIKGSSLINNGLLICGGYIKEVDSNLNYVNNKNWSKPVYSAPSINVNDATYFSTITITSIGELRMPYVIHDYRGGSSTAATYAGTKTYTLADIGDLTNVKGNIFPFNRFDLPNIQTKLLFEYGSLLKGYADLYTGAVAGIVDAQHNTTPVTLIGTVDDSPLIVMEDGAEITCECVTKTPGVTSSDFNTRKTTITIDGNININYMSFTLAVAILNVSMTSQDVLFPCCDLFDFIFISGDSNIDVNIKVLPGCNIVVRNGATLNFGKERASQLIAFSDFNDGSTIAPKYPSSSELGQTGAKIYNDGVINILSKASFGGAIYSFNTNGRVNIDSNAILSFQSIEGYGSLVFDKGQFYLDATFAFTFHKTNTIREQANAYLYKEGAVSSTTSQLSSGVYRSILDDNGNYGWVQEQINITFDPNHSDLLSYEILPETRYTVNDDGDVTGYIILESDLHSISKPSSLVYYKYDWSLHPTEFIDPVNFMTYESVTLYAIWSPIEYEIGSITYKYYDEKGNLVEASSVINHSDNPASGDKFTVKTVSELLSPTHSEYKFGGWYTEFNDDTKELSNRVYNFVGANYLYNGVVQDITLYGFWSYGDPITINYTFDDNAPEGINPITATSVALSQTGNYNFPDTYDGYETNYTKEKYISGWKLNGVVSTIENVRGYLEGLKAGSSIELEAVWTTKASVQIIGQRDPSLIDDNTTAKERLFNTSNLTAYQNAIDDTIYLTTQTLTLSSLHHKGTPYTNSNGTYEFYKFTCNNKECTSVDIVNGGVYVIYANYLKQVSVVFKASMDLGDAGYLKGDYMLDSDIIITITKPNNTTTSITIMKAGSNTGSYNDASEEIMLLEGSTFTINTPRATATSVIGIERYKDPVTINPKSGKVLDNDSQNYNIEIK